MYQPPSQQISTAAAAEPAESDTDVRVGGAGHTEKIKQLGPADRLSRTPQVQARYMPLDYEGVMLIQL